MKNYLLDLLYPPRCAVCRCIVKINGPRLLCPDCAGGFVPIGIDGPSCVKCGAPTGVSSRVCPSCNKKTHILNSNYALFLYEGREREIIMNLKYYFGPPLMEFIQKIMTEAFDKTKLVEADYIIPVPIHRKKEKNRGFNQSYLLALCLSEITGVPILKDVLLRVKNTQAQSGLGFHERLLNIKDAFDVPQKAPFDEKSIIQSKVIILVDDIYTTGSTMNECASVLLKNGAKSVNGFTFCVTSHKNRDALDSV